MQMQVVKEQKHRIEQCFLIFIYNYWSGFCHVWNKFNFIFTGIQFLFGFFKCFKR